MTTLVGVLSASIAAAVMSTLLLSAGPSSISQIEADCDALCPIASDAAATLATATVASEPAGPRTDGEQEDGELHATVAGAAAEAGLSCHHPSSIVDDYVTRPYLPPERLGSRA